MSLAELDRLGRFEILGPIGAGGMGEVYRALDRGLKREVAIKVLPAEMAGETERVRRFETEAQAAAALNPPNILAVYDVGIHEGAPYLVTELLEGETLRERIRAGGLTLAKAVEHAVPVAEGLAAAHAKGIIHRDLKTENLFLTTDGRVKILDFGLATLTEPEVGEGQSLTESVATQSGAVMGTAGYMAPELVRGVAADARSDIFSFGVVLYEMLCGRRPFVGATVGETMSKILNEDPPALGPPVPPALQRIVGRCLEKRPEDRFSSAHDLALALEALQELPVRVVPPPAPEEARPYPGLASFTEADAEFFFGRETEVAELWRKIPERKLLGIIGPSGAGKSSFIRAGVLPNKPTGWGIVVCTPGNAATASLREALVPEMAGDTEGMRDLIRVDDPDAMVSAVTRWRERWDHALIIVDQLEELFTQTAPGEQARFVKLIAQLTVRADVGVALCLRDDFLIHTQEHEPLRPILESLTVLLPPTGKALRRALVEPAVQSGFEFEDRALVDEMLIEVEEERGALPLLALGQLELEADPTAALAWARASLEVFDTREGRLFALRSLSKGPVARVLPLKVVGRTATFSPDGGWLAFQGFQRFEVHRRSGGPAVLVDSFQTRGQGTVWPFFDASSRRLSVVGMGEARSYGVPGFAEIARGQLPDPSERCSGYPLIRRSVGWCCALATRCSGHSPRTRRSSFPEMMGSFTGWPLRRTVTPS